MSDEKPALTFIERLFDRARGLTLSEFFVLGAVGFLALFFWAAYAESDLYVQLKQSPVWAFGLIGAICVMIAGALLARAGAKGEKQAADIINLFRERLDAQALEIKNLRAMNEQQQIEINELRIAVREAQEAERECRELVSRFRNAPTEPGSL